MLTRQDLPSLIQGWNQSYQQKHKEAADAAALQSSQAHDEEGDRLKAYLTGQQKEADVGNALSLNKQKIAQETEQLGNMQDKFGTNVGLKAGDTSVTPRDMLSLQLRKDAMDQKQEKVNQVEQENISKRYEKTTGFQSALQDLESLTNQDGKGGILTNKNALLPGTGMVSSKIPDSAMGIGEFLGAVPKGTMETRKALARLQLEYQKAMSGAKQSDELRNKEQAAMGNAFSSDPQLAAKGVRALAQNVKNHLNTIRSGYHDANVSTVNERLGGDPMAMYSKLVDDSPMAQGNLANQGAGSSAPAVSSMGGPLPVQAAPQTTAPQQKQVVKKQHNQALGKTRVTYSDGSNEVLDGLQ